MTVAAHALLNAVTGSDSSARRRQGTIGRMAALAGALGEPQRAFPAIQITGTNGKGSTTAMTASLLTGQGLRVGSYSGPHLARIAERVQIDGRPVDDLELTEALDVVAGAAQRSGISPTWFEAMTAAGLWLFATRGVDVAVVEVGGLGRLDATNIINARTAVITNIELDHTDIAGPTRSAIAHAEAGIIRRGATLILGERDPRLLPPFAAQSPGLVLTTGKDLVRRNRRITPTGSVIDLTTPWGSASGVRIGMIGAHQCDNALLAVAAAEAFLGMAIPAHAIDAALQSTSVPGRFEVIGSSPTLVLDGAHNAAAAAALHRALQETFRQAKPRVLLWGARRGHDPGAFLSSLHPSLMDLIVTTEPPSAQAVPAERLARIVRCLHTPLIPIPDPVSALRHAVAAAGRTGLVVATGSLYLLESLRSPYVGSSE